VEIDIAGEGFHCKGLQVLELNYLEVYPYDRWTDKSIPQFYEGEQLQPKELLMKQVTKNIQRLDHHLI
jgi:DNA topoisomerase-3